MNMDIPKQYIEVNDRMIITESIRPFLECELVSAVQIVADEMWREMIIDEYRVLSDYYLGEMKLSISMSDSAEGSMDFSTDVVDVAYPLEDRAVYENDHVRNCDEEGLYKFHGFSDPGDNRQLSILNGLKDVYGDCCDSVSGAFDEDVLVIVHDAARPLVSVALISACINACEGHDGVMPVLPMKDTVYLSEDGKAVSSLINRDQIFAGQAPEVYRLERYIKACEKLLPDKIMDIRGSTEPAIMDGMDIVMVPGDEGNFKITTRADLERYIELVGAE
jgi:2-C-methyl-D-erythritol 4-phosphate cytidylyltransferase